MTEEEARRLWERAAELQAEADPRGQLSESDGEVPTNTSSPGYAVDVVRQAALDAGIDREFVDKARYNWLRRLVAWVKRRVLRWQVLDQSSLKEDS